MNYHKKMFIVKYEEEIPFNLINSNLLILNWNELTIL